MIRTIAFIVALALSAGAAHAAAHLERVVLVIRHGIRPPTVSNAELAKYAAKSWPDWPVPPGELTPHGGLSVTLMGKTLRARYAARGLLPATGCAPVGQVSVWADGTDQRTRKTGELLTDALQPGCNLKTGWAAAQPRDPIFAGSNDGACKLDAASVRLSPPNVAELAALAEPTRRLQAIVAPKACDGGPGTCFTPKGGAAPGQPGSMTSAFPPTSSLAEDLYLEYVDGKPMSQVGWGKAGAADIADVMRIHEFSFGRIRDNRDIVSRRGAPMARVILAALKGEAAKGGPQSGPDLKVLGLAGHDSNLAYMGGVFGLEWTLPGDPDFTAPSTVLAFELWRDGKTDYVRPVIYYETLSQLRTLTPASAERLPLAFDGCADGPNGSCPLATVEARLEAILPEGCG